MCGVIASRWQTRCASPSVPDRPQRCFPGRNILSSFRQATCQDRSKVSHRCNSRVSPKEWMEKWICLWDFVGTTGGFATVEHHNQANPRSFMQVLGCEFPTIRWHTVCSPLLQRCSEKDWLPGVAGSQPRLGFRFWGVSSKEEGGLHQPPFSFWGG
jgi:hypothetical protein